MEDAELTICFGGSDNIICRLKLGFPLTIAGTTYQIVAYMALHQIPFLMGADTLRDLGIRMDMTTNRLTTQGGSA